MTEKQDLQMDFNQHSACGTAHTLSAALLAHSQSSACLAKHDVPSLSHQSNLISSSQQVSSPGGEIQQDTEGSKIMNLCSSLDTCLDQAHLVLQQSESHILPQHCQEPILDNPLWPWQSDTPQLCTELSVDLLHRSERLAEQGPQQSHRGDENVGWDDCKSSTADHMQLLPSQQSPSCVQLTNPVAITLPSFSCEQQSRLSGAGTSTALALAQNTVLCAAPGLPVHHPKSNAVCLQPASQALTKNAATGCYTSADTSADLSLGASALDLSVQLSRPWPRDDHSNADPSPWSVPAEKPEQLPWWSCQVALARGGTDASLGLSSWDLTALRLELLGVDAPAPDPESIDDILARVSRAQGLDLAGGCEADRLTVMDSSPFSGTMSGTCDCATARDMPGKASGSHSSPDQVQEDILHADVQCLSGIGSFRDYGHEQHAAASTSALPSRNTVVREDVSLHQLQAHCMFPEPSKAAAGEKIDAFCCQHQQQQDKPSAPSSELELNHLDSEVQAIMTRLGMEPLPTVQNTDCGSSAEAG